MYRSMIFSIFLFLSSMTIDARNLPTLGSPGSGTLYACAVAKEDIATLDVDNSGTYRTKTGFTTYCRRVIDQHMSAKTSIVDKYTANHSDLFTIVARFFWYWPDHMSAGSAALKSYCKRHHDHFKDCKWTKTPAAETSSASSISNMKVLIEGQGSADLTKDGVYGCAVILCLANPNGWGSVAECKPPVKKLFRNLAKGKGWPNCSSEFRHD